MAIKITKPGQKEFHAFCRWCGCEFTYEISDLKLSASSDKVSCPTCGKDYHHPSMVQDPTLPSGISYQWPSDSTDPCAGCIWGENLKQNNLYTGDIPCTWCNKGRVVNLTGIDTCTSVKDYTTPCINQLDVNLSTSTSSALSGTKYTTAYNCADGADCKEDITQGTVMQTVLGCCSNATSSGSCNCDGTEPKSCSGEHKCGGKKNCKSKH